MFEPLSSKVKRSMLARESLCGSVVATLNRTSFEFTLYKRCSRGGNDDEEDNRTKSDQQSSSASSHSLFPSPFVDSIPGFSRHIAQVLAPNARFLSIVSHDVHRSRLLLLGIVDNKIADSSSCTFPRQSQELRQSRAHAADNHRRNEPQSGFLRPFENATCCCAVSPNSLYVAHGFADGSYEVFSTMFGICVLCSDRLDASDPTQFVVAPVTCLAFSPDSTILAIGFGDGDVEIRFHKRWPENSKLFEGFRRGSHNRRRIANVFFASTRSTLCALFSVAAAIDEPLLMWPLNTEMFYDDDDEDSSRDSGFSSIPAILFYLDAPEDTVSPADVSNKSELSVILYQPNIFEGRDGSDVIRILMRNCDNLKLRVDVESSVAEVYFGANCVLRWRKPLPKITST